MTDLALAAPKPDKQHLRRQRRAAGLCALCGRPSGSYRCGECAAANSGTRRGGETIPHLPVISRADHPAPGILTASGVAMLERMRVRRGRA